MRNKLGPICAFIGFFLVVIGVLAQVYAAGAVKKTPLDVDSTTRLTGSAELSNSAGLEVFPVKVTSVTKADSDKSDGDVVVFTNSSCVVKDLDDAPDCVSSDDPENRLITASIDDFATDRVTGLAVNKAKYLPAEAVPHDGLVNKWPFDVERKDYPYWNGTVGEAVTAVYDRTEKIDGFEVYVFTVDVADAPIQIAEGVNGTFNSSSEISVDPVTGSIINQISSQERLLEDGSPVLALEAKYTEDQVKTNIDDAEANGSSISLLTKTVPLIGYLVGIPLLLLGIFMVVRGERERDPKHEA